MMKKADKDGDGDVTENEISTYISKLGKIARKSVMLDDENSSR